MFGKIQTLPSTIPERASDETTNISCEVKDGLLTITFTILKIAEPKEITIL
jgi:hypothetical protein